MIQPRAPLTLLLACLLLAACHRGSSRQIPEGEWISAGPLLTVDAMGADFFEEQDVHLQWPGDDLRVRAVLQKRDAVLELITLDPRAQPILRITHTGDEVSLEAYTDRSLPFEPQYIIADVQKAFATWPLTPSADEAETPGGGALYQGRYRSLRYEEERRNGRVTRRRFWRDDLPEQSVVVVRYDYGDAGETLQEVRVDNGWFGYVLAVRILRRQLL
jgi:hypothetical protein